MRRVCLQLGAAMPRPSDEEALLDSHNSTIEDEFPAGLESMNSDYSVLADVLAPGCGCFGDGCSTSGGVSRSTWKLTCGPHRYVSVRCRRRPLPPAGACGYLTHSYRPLLAARTCVVRTMLHTTCTR